MKIIEIYLPIIEKMAIAKTGNSHDGMDLVQDVCERLLIKRELLEHLPIIEQRKYVNRVLNNVFIDGKRAEKRNRRNKELYLNEQVFSIQPIGVRRLVALKDLDMVASRFRRHDFKVRWRTLVVLRYMGYRFKRISEITGVPVNTLLPMYVKVLDYLRQQRPIKLQRGFNYSLRRSLFSSGDMAVIKEMYESGFTNKELSKMFGVHEETVSEIGRKRGWQKLKRGILL